MIDARKFAPLVAFSALAGCSGGIHNRTPSPDGTYEARLGQGGPRSNRVFYSVTITGPGQPENGCLAAELRGQRMENYVRFDWVGARALHIRYGIPPGDHRGAPQPFTQRGNDQRQACEDFTVTFAEDASLTAAAEQTYREMFRFTPQRNTLEAPLNAAGPANSSAGEP